MTAPAPLDPLREALKDAVELAEEGWGYASDYFKDKWAFADRLAALRAALSAPVAPTSGEARREALEEVLELVRITFACEGAEHYCYRLCDKVRALAASPSSLPRGDGETITERMSRRAREDGLCGEPEPGLGYPCAHKAGHLDQGRPHATRTGRQWWTAKGETRRVCHFEGEINGVVHVCNRAATHGPPHVMELFKRDTPHEPPAPAPVSSSAPAPDMERLVDALIRASRQYARISHFKDAQDGEVAARTTLLDAIRAMAAERDEADRNKTEAIRERERREDEIAAIASVLGCEDEWSNAHDHGECALELARELRERVEKAASALSALRQRVEALAKEWEELAPEMLSSIRREILLNHADALRALSDGREVGP